MFNPATLAAVGLLALAAPPAVPAVAPVPAVPAAPAWAADAGHRDLDEIPAALDWEVKPAEGDAPAGSVQFQIGFRTPHHMSSFGQTLDLASLDGLSAAQLSAE